MNPESHHYNQTDPKTSERADSFSLSHTPSRWLHLFRRFPELRRSASLTRNGEFVELTPEIKSLDQLSGLQKLGLLSPGVFRSDRLLMRCGNCEETQVRLYQDLFEGSSSSMVTIQTVFQGQKVLAALSGEFQDGQLQRAPILGELGARFALGAGRALFHRQIRAILRASHNRPAAGIIVPMGTESTEVARIREEIDSVQTDLRTSRIAFNHQIKLGISLEVVAAAYSIRSFINYVDFLSVPTTRLIQRTLAVDRKNERVKGLFDAAHPAIARLLQLVLAESGGKPVHVSGEFVNNGRCPLRPGVPILTPLLIGLGVRVFNPTPEVFPALKLLIQRIDTSAATRFARELESYSSGDEIRLRCYRLSRQLAPELFESR